MLPVPAAPGAPPAPMLRPPMPAPHPMAPSAPVGSPMPPSVMPGAPGAAPMPAAPPPPPPPMIFDVGTFQAAVSLLRDQKLRGFRVDIETQSTIAADEAQERADASQFVQALGAMMQSSLPMMQAMPAVTPLIGSFMLFVARRYGVGVELEGKLEDAIAKLEGNPGAAMQNPKMGEAQMKQQMLQTQMTSKQQDTASKQALAQQKMQQDAADHQMDLQGRQMEFQADQVKAAAEMKKAMLDEQMARAEHDRSIQQAQMDHSVAMAQAAVPLPPQKLQFGAGMVPGRR